MKFISTRDVTEFSNSTTAILTGIAKSEGLYVPQKFPDLSCALEKFLSMNYLDLTFEILKEFFDDLDEEELRATIIKAYDGKFTVKLNKNFLELYHGPTSAFKDAALLLLPQILECAKKQENIKENIAILAATSGDTGTAALEGFSLAKSTKVIVLYPKHGVSYIQKQQMITHGSDNSHVIAIDGNFDDAQKCVKSIFNNKEIKNKLLKNGYLLNSANSINIGRIIAQIVYYFYGYLELVRTKQINLGDKINICVPTGNFGNILASYYAKKMKLPINNFICASNENNTLTKFIDEGIYDIKRKLILTKSPSMDILLSSNLERFLFEISNRDDDLVKKFMSDLKTNGYYQITNNMKEKMKDFFGFFATDQEVISEIRDLYSTENYLMDTHTAVAYNAYKKYKIKTEDIETKTLIASTASPFKFSQSIIEALNLENEKNEFDMLNIISTKTNIPIPVNLANLNNKKIVHNLECDKNNIEDIIMGILGENL
ncbi:MAG: threonine synthase [Sarcina sp.]